MKGGGREALIVGLGHIGASLAQRMSARGWRVAGWDKSAAAVRHCLRRRWIASALAVDEAAPRFSSDVAGSLCVLALPEGAVRDREVVRLLAALPEGTLVTDVFSSKGEATRFLADLCEGLGLQYAWSHPLAGRENFGFESADAAIFDGATVLVDAKAPAALRSRLSAFWRGLGCKVEPMDSRTHQRRMAAGSHLMHALAFSVVHTVRASEGLLPSVLGVTRVAKSSPEGWTEIFLSNRAELVAAIARLRSELAKVEALIRGGDRARLARYLGQARQARLKMERH